MSSVRTFRPATRWLAMPWSSRSAVWQLRCDLRSRVSPTARRSLRGIHQVRLHPQFEFEIDLFEPSENPRAGSADDDVQVTLQDGQWVLQRGDFRARWDAPKAAVTFVSRATRMPSTLCCASFTR